MADVVDRLAFPHPGEILNEEFLMPLDIPPVTLAEGINAPLSEIVEIIAGKRDIDEDMAKRLGGYFNVDPEFWNNLQTFYNRKLESVGGK